MHSAEATIKTDRVYLAPAWSPRTFDTVTIETIPNMPAFRERAAYVSEANGVEFITIPTNDDEELEKVILFGYRICNMKEEAGVLTEMDNIDKAVFFAHCRRMLEVVPWLERVCRIAREVRIDRYNAFSDDSD